MFCQKCGAELENSAVFCTKCGAKVGNSEEAPKEKIKDDQVQLEVKPTFKFAYMVLPSLIFYVIVVAIITAMLSIASIIGGLFIGACLLILACVILGIKALLNKKQYDNYRYDFYKTKVIYQDSFINISEKEVKYKYIREVVMRQTFIQRWFNLGNIILFTNAETGFANGIYIVNVENVQEVYQNIKSIIEV